MGLTKQDILGHQEANDAVFRDNGNPKTHTTGVEVAKAGRKCPAMSPRCPSMFAGYLEMSAVGLPFAQADTECLYTFCARCSDLKGKLSRGFVVLVRVLTLVRVTGGAAMAPDSNTFNGLWDD